ncbi:hypothetical protein AAFF_G00021400 [Aldrovandia affinis]|uniref:RING-type domain-containing protein n=1 Tax=Aldrovandia affinis TaxID=143900 RepID=A0AAD7R2M7_9TELE|nr:hypothetical protein AAFF_G00021400 [Aldrovandia affinis]
MAIRPNKICAVCLEEFKQKDELGICPCKHTHRKCLIKWLEVRKVCPLCNMPVLQCAQQQDTTEPQGSIQQPLPGMDNPVYCPVQSLPFIASHSSVQDHSDMTTDRSTAVTMQRPRTLQS